MPHGRAMPCGVKKSAQPTINDVARIAGVSKKTVSRVINLGNARSRATPNGMADRTARTTRALAALVAR